MTALTIGLIARSLLCGGSLVSTTSVLTAAHCVDLVFSFDSLRSQLRVTVGTNRWNSGGQTYSVSRNVTHPNYVAHTSKNDIGILILNTPIQVLPTANPISLSYDFVGDAVETRVAGWGRISNGGALSATLLELTSNTIDGDRCVAEVARVGIELNLCPPHVEPHIELCTIHSAGHGTCNGDSGSALVRTDTNQQIGIVSWGIPCARGAPDVFTRISAYKDFLQQHINDY